jgi:hypothetical protein
MGLLSYSVAITAASNVTVTATMCSAPTYTVSSVKLSAQPVFSEYTSINNTQYQPGENLVRATGGTVVSSSPYIVVNATTATVAATVITGVYSSATTSAAFVLPFGATYDAATKEYETAGSPRQYDYSAYFIKSAGGSTSVADMIIGGTVQMRIGYTPRVPSDGSSTYRACSVTQV